MTCTVSYTAANFKMYDQYAYPPNCPMYLAGSPPNRKTVSVSETDILDSLPDPQHAVEIMELARLLDAKITKALGDFEVCLLFSTRLTFRPQFSTVS